ncbi:MAG: GxxExxY protein [Nitrospinae bacterium]|nr:GxxExxY protein [Nitrospinota bacterium]
MEHKEITEKIIGCAYKVYNQMGSGFLESVYEKCMMIELKSLDLDADAQKPIKVYYGDIIVGEFIADIIVNGSIILELKAVRKINKIHEVQLVNYLVATRKSLGLLLNFGDEKVEVKRKVKVLKSIK